MSYLEIKDINKSFAKKEVLKDINIDIKQGEFVCLLGPSGCGKTTLLRIISGLENKDTGNILLNNEDITNLKPGKRGFGMVFQDYVLFPNMTVWNNIAYGLKNKKFSKQEIKEKVEEVLNLVNLTEHSSKYPSELSGGQKQRVAIARAIALKPSLFLLDEPLSALDAKVRERLRYELKELQRKLGITTIMVTHDQEEALTMADRIVVMNEAEIIQIGTPEEIYKKPNSKFVADFIGSANFIEEDEELMVIRPEEVNYSFKFRAGFKEGNISDIEFRGAFYRVKVKIKSIDETIIVDLSSTLNEAKNLKVEDKIFIDISENIKIKAV